MPQANFDLATSKSTERKSPFPLTSENYSDVLDHYELTYEISDYYLKVGKINQTQGWILHISIVISQALPLFGRIIPQLIKEGLPFKIPISKETCQHLLNGDLGVPQIGKIVCIYPESDHQALSLAKKLVCLTEGLKGPAVPTDIRLGNVVFTRYGSFNPVIIPNSQGKEEKYIYDENGQLVIDSYLIPFQLPSGIKWPFGELATAQPPSTKMILNYKYRPLSIIKTDPKGNVYKGLFLKSLFQVKTCIIKQGIQHMSSEETGRDIHDRLVWQKMLYESLPSDVPVPKIFDLFIQEGHTYLAMEYIKGKSLQETFGELNPDHKSWHLLEMPKKQTLLNYVIRITEIISKLHQQGVVHRDIAPSNFLVNKSGDIFLIDMELAYSIRQGIPNPPFEYGTFGFMSPQQQYQMPPTVEDDIYSLGATIVRLITGLLPSRIDVANTTRLFENLLFLIGDQEICVLLSKSLSPDPKDRPIAKQLALGLHKYRAGLTSIHSTQVQNKKRPDSTQLKEVIQAALNGLSQSPTILLNDYWYSKLNTVSNQSIMRQKEYTRYIGLAEGIAGVLYTLARAKRSDFNIDCSLMGYEKGWGFIKEKVLSKLETQNRGLYKGSAGVGLTLAEGFRSNLLPADKEATAFLRKCFEKPSETSNIANGIAGQYASGLQCIDYLKNAFFDSTVSAPIEALLDRQRPSGEFLIQEMGQIPESLFSFSTGYGGIIWTLLKYGAHREHQASLTAADKALYWLIKNRSFSVNLSSVFSNKNMSGRQVDNLNKYRNLALTFFKAHEILKNAKYKTLGEQLLSHYSPQIITNSLVQLNGIAGLGELYLEAAALYNSQEWKEKAEWIVQLLLHTVIRNVDGSGYWQLEERNAPTADFMVGTSGLIHFMIRYSNFGTLGYPLLE